MMNKEEKMICETVLETEKQSSQPKQWLHPNQVMQLYSLKVKKKKLQGRIQRLSVNSETTSKENDPKTVNVEAAMKRRNPFIRDSQDKKPRLESSVLDLEESSNQTLFKLLNFTESTNNTKNQITSFTNILRKNENDIKNQITCLTNNLNKNETTTCEVQHFDGKPWIPIDWSLKSKIRFISPKPFPWNQKLKISEEASGITGFVRCLDTDSETTLDTSPNAKFHQCCLYWQQPMLPWLTLFPRSIGRISASGTSVAVTPTVRDGLQTAWSNSLRSLFQLIRIRQCPYFYVCANSFTILFRAAGICGFTEVHVLVMPTTRGFRQMLRQEEIEFKMPLKRKRASDQGHETLDSTGEDTLADPELNIAEEEEEEPANEDWLSSLGVNAEDIKQINYRQQKLKLKAESAVDNSEQSLVLIEGVEVNAFFNFLLNCKSTISLTGPLAGIPPTLLAPVAFHGATLSSLRVRENKVHVDNTNYYSLELSGPILPHTVHNLCSIKPFEHDFTVTFANVNATVPFCKVFKSKDLDSSIDEKREQGSVVFRQANLSDCGLNAKVLKHFCSPEAKFIANVECLKYTSESKRYTWS